MIRKLLAGLALTVFVSLGALAAYILLAESRAPVPLPVRAERPRAETAGTRPPPNPLRNAYFGETHLHTSYSLDANLFGTKNDPRTAYRFAMGEEITLSDTGLKQRIRTPLDFAAVTDHAEGLGSYAQCNDKHSETYWSLDCVGMRYQVLLIFPRLMQYNQQKGRATGTYNPGACGPAGRLCIESAKTVWAAIQDAANEYYQPGRFTTFIGFEYSPTLTAGGMLHRNVIFRGDHVPDSVFSAYDGFAEDMLRWLEQICTGACQALSIPHNPNLSWGLMFGEMDSDTRPISRESLQLRARLETLIEIFQAKGSSECAQTPGNNDEQCGFENILPACQPGEERIDPATGLHRERCVGPNDMVRGVLKKGLLDEKKLGFNPFKFGIVAGTDNHNGAPGDTDESTYKGHGGRIDAIPARRLGRERTLVSDSLGFPLTRLNPGGITGVWAEENTREAIFDAMKRKETFATSGTRLRLRLFGSFDYPAALHRQPGMIKTAYALGVHMGGDLPNAPTGKAPSFLVQATADPNSARLEKIQIVKAWVADGVSHERVFDVVCGDGNGPEASSGRCPATPNTSNPATCEHPHSGTAELATTWRDPDFHSTDSALYYARVLETPVCRWSQYDVNALQQGPVDGVPAFIQERAWTSPIWYQSANVTSPR